MVWEDLAPGLSLSFLSFFFSSAWPSTEFAGITRVYFAGIKYPVLCQSVNSHVLFWILCTRKIKMKKLQANPKNTSCLPASKCQLLFSPHYKQLKFKTSFFLLSSVPGSLEVLCCPYATCYTIKSVLLLTC